MKHYAIAPVAANNGAYGKGRQHSAHIHASIVEMESETDSRPQK
jgi:hypothetical protein